MSSSIYSMKLKTTINIFTSNHHHIAQLMTISTLTQNLPTLNDNLCSETTATSSPPESPNSNHSPSFLSGENRYLTREARVEKAWTYWKAREPKLIVAPTVDNSKIPFQLLCKKYGATRAYNPMLHSRIFSENEKYRSQEFTTCKEDWPLFVQVCANDPDILLEAARRVKAY